MSKAKEEIISIEKVKEIISNVINEFVQQEIGNRITRFNIQGFANVLLSSIISSVESDDQVKEKNEKIVVK